MPAVSQERYNVLDDELDKNDYTYLFTGQFRQTSDLIDSPANNGLIIADTNSTITMAYAGTSRTVCLGRFPSLNGCLPVHD